MIPNLTCAYFFRWVCEKPPTTNPFSCCWCSASQNDFPYLEIWKEFGMASSKVSCFFSRQITLRLATFCRNHRSEMLHVWNMYLHLAHIYGKSIGKCSIHEAYADLNRPSYPRQDAFWVAPNASGRCHQWYRQFVLTSNRCNGNPMICMINICIYILWCDRWPGDILRGWLKILYMLFKHGKTERNPSPYICSFPENCQQFDMKSLSLLPSWRPSRVCAERRSGWLQRYLNGPHRVLLPWWGELLRMTGWNVWQMSQPRSPTAAASFQPAMLARR